MAGSETLLQLINLRSFSSVWYWIVVIAVWSRLSYSALGVPYDMVLRARRQGGGAMADLEALLAVQLRRRAGFAETGGLILAAVWAAGVVFVAVLGFGYGVELAQAGALLLLPLSLVWLLRLRLVLRLCADPPKGLALCLVFQRHRRAVQMIAVFAILITTFWGVWFTLTTPILGP